MRRLTVGVLVALTASVFAAPVPVVKKNQWLISMDGELFLFTEGDEKPTRLTENRGGYSDPAWSPDGKRIAFCRDQISYKQIGTMDADGKNEVQLTKIKRQHYSPNWSPDGKTIAFSRHTENKSGCEICTLSTADGDDLQVLSKGNGHCPQFSPDGSLIAFVSSVRTGVQAICMMGPDGRNEKELIKFRPYGEGPPVWSPDGKWIAFAQRDDSGSQICVMKPDGEGLKAISSFPRDKRPSCPSWSPNGKRISFVLTDFPDGKKVDSQDLLWVMDANGENQKELLRVDRKFSVPYALWRPK